MGGKTLNKDIPGNESDALAVSLAIVFGLAIGWLDLHTTEVAVTILSLLFAGGLLGLLRPARAWRWALLVSAGIPLVELAGLTLQLATAEPIHVDPRVWLVVLGFALVGTYLGVAIRSIVPAGKVI